MKRHQKETRRPTAPRQGTYRVVDLNDQQIVIGDFPSRAEARRHAKTIATYVPKGNNEDNPVAYGYRWDQVPNGL